MKKALLLLLFIVFNHNLQAQTPNIGQYSTAEVVEGGIQISIDVFTMMATSYLGHTYAVEDNLLKVTACYHETILAMPSDYTIEIFIPIANPELYNVEIYHYNSLVSEECDYYSLFDSSFIPLHTANFEQDSQNVLLFPNPAKDQFEIQTKVLEIKSVKFYNSLGQLVKISKTLKNDVSELANGIYIVLLETENGILTRRLLINK